MTCCGNLSEVMPLNETRFEHDEPGSCNEKPERDIMEIKESNYVDRNEKLENLSHIIGEEKEKGDSCCQKNTLGTHIPEGSLDYDGFDFVDKIRMKEKFENEKQEPFKEDNNEELEKANLTSGDTNPPLNNYEKPKLGTCEKENTDKRQTKRRTKRTKELRAKHLKLKEKQKKTKKKGKTDTRTIHKQGLHKEIFNQDNVIIKSNDRHRGSYIPRKKLNQSVRLGILLLAVLCIVHISEESTVNWQLRGLVYFGKTAILDCVLNATSNGCHDDTVTRWSKYGHNKTSVITINGYSSNNSKYKEQVNKQCTVSSLIIKNFDQNDIADYTCGFGLMEYSKELKLEIDSFRSYPAKENINVVLLCSHSNLRLDLKMRNIFPRPTCYSDIENDGVQHKKIRTDLSGVLYNTEDMVGFLLKDRSCSGIIHTFCSFEETKIEVFNSTYDCCSDSKPSLALKVSISFLSVTTFAVIMCFVCLCKSKKIGNILRRAESSRSEQPLSLYSDSVEIE